MYFPSEPFPPRPESRRIYYKYFYNHNPPLTRWPFVKSRRPLAPAAVAPLTTTFLSVNKRYSIRIKLIGTCPTLFFLFAPCHQTSKVRWWLSFCSSNSCRPKLHFFLVNHAAKEYPVKILQFLLQNENSPLLTRIKDIIVMTRHFLSMNQRLDVPTPKIKIHNYIIIIPSHIICMIDNFSFIFY